MPSPPARAGDPLFLPIRIDGRSLLITLGMIRVLATHKRCNGVHAAADPPKLAIAPAECQRFTIFGNGIQEHGFKL